MTDDPTPVAPTPFAALRHVTADSGEYWSARELAPVLGYTNWRNFRIAVAKAQLACANSGQVVADHFDASIKVIRAGKGAQQRLADWHLSRYACYLIVQNADPSKPIVALGQTYFAVQTHRQEQADALAQLTEAQRRLELRGQMTQHNRELTATAQQAGLVSGADFAIFQDHGYLGLYGGERARDIHRRKGLKRSQNILDHMGSDELAANNFRASQTRQKIERERIQGREAANRAHHAVGRKVRQTIAELGGTLPEDLPTPAESIQQVQRREQRRLEQEQAGQQSLFDALPSGPDES